MKRRLLTWGAAVVLLTAAALLLPDARPGKGRPWDPVDLNAEVVPGQCAPCHLEIGDIRKPNLVFGHGAHLRFACSSCHAGNPHAGNGTITPPMQTCFNCHGVPHGPEGPLATRECADCHPAPDKLRPKSHVRGWEGEPHADRTRKGGKEAVNDCMMCHEAKKDCDACHVKAKLKVGPMPPRYYPVYRVRPKQPVIKIYPDKPTSISQCIQCHPDVDAFMPGRLIFAHAEHLRRDYKCVVCHPQFGHGPEQIRRPDMRSCYRCHGLTHAGQGVVATERCDKCHPRRFELKPPDHTKAFERGQHKKLANADAAYCAMCHTPEFCVECHMGRRGYGGKPVKKVIPVDHRKAKWRVDHGGLYLQQKGACGSCHDSPSCTKCHQTVMPHPEDWLAKHDAEGRQKRDCNVCHRDRDTCQKCHHDKVKRAELIASNCVKCHDEMKQKPPTRIKNKAFAEHAVHFAVGDDKAPAETRARNEGKPYVCDDCHVEFGDSSAAQQAELNQGHDLRLCYTCHGSLDWQNRQIAPWPGSGLCRRCHTDLNI